MKKLRTSIPVNDFSSECNSGISVGKMFLKDISNHQEAYQSERHDRHSFHLLESGTVKMEIDFQTFHLIAPVVVYMHPDQVHRMISFENAVVVSWAINDENLNLEYIKMLEELSPAGPLQLNEESFLLLSDVVSLCLEFSVRQHDKLHHLLLKDSCNTLVCLTILKYLKQASANTLSRFEIVAKAFRVLLQHNFRVLKRPAEYAEKLNISAPYLNECVKNTTGHPVSYHIRQRVILEAKRLLHHSDKSIKEIATFLGFDDYPYFSRLFSKTAGISAQTFRNKNHE
jgi:AraC family transcriptional activator of pobA